MELLDIYDDEGKPTGRVIVRDDKSEVITEHEHIAVTVIFIENNENKYLIQKTSKEKGGYYSATGGHITHNETPMSTILREVEEELGIQLKEEEIQDLGFIQYDMPLRYLYYCKKDIPLETIKAQEEEVESVDYKTKEEIEELIDKKEFLSSHGVLFHKLQEIIKEER